MERLFTMSKQEITRLEILQRLIDRKITQVQAGEILHMGTRQIQRLVRTYRLQGVAGLISKKRGKPGNRALPKTIKEYATTLVKQHYHDFGPTLAAEKLLEYHDIKLSVETVRSLMIEAGLWISRNKRLKRSFQPRYRRERFGELIQIDGSHHRWFEDRGPKCALLVYVDDATSKLTALHFAPSESMHSYFTATQKHLSAYGKPIAFYSDKFSVFKVTSKNAQDEMITQFGRGLSELNIDLICANTCQAKGRVERANKTLQDRLVKDLRLKSISTIEDANRYAPAFIEDYNKRFGKPPIVSGDSHRPLQAYENLVESLCFKQKRTVSKNLTIQYDRVQYLIEDTVDNRSLRRQKIMLHEYPDGSITLNYEGKNIIFRKLFDRVGPAIQGEIVENHRLAAVLDYIKNDQEIRVMTRSTRCPSKTHLGIHSPTQKTKAA